MTSRDVIVIGGGPSGVMAAVRAAELGARTTLVTSEGFGGMAANDGPAPVRTLAQAARLIRGARKLDRFGIATSPPELDYPKLLERVSRVVEDVRSRSALRADIDRLGVELIENAGNARFTDAHTIEISGARRMQASTFIICVGGTSRRLSAPGVELTATHSDAWSLTRIPRSIVVVGAGMTGAQVASIFHAFGSQMSLLQRGPRILPEEDEDVSAAVARAFRDSGITVRENFGAVDSFERVEGGVRMNISRDGVRESVEAELIVLATGWIANTQALHLPLAGVELNARGFIAVDAQLRTSASHVYAAGDVTGRWMLVPQAIQDGWIAATNAVRGSSIASDAAVSPTGGFTDPEYARVGLTERAARLTHEVVTVIVRFDETTRTIIDDRTEGFCKLLVDRSTQTIMGCHVVGERAVEIVQIAAIAMSSRMRVDELARIPLSFPTYTGILMRAAYRALEQLGANERWTPA